MGMVFGKIFVETPKYEVIHSSKDYEIRKYTSSVVAEVTYDPSQFKGDDYGGFEILASYTGVLGKPQNTKPEMIAMTAPVLTKTDGGGEKIAMTAPVLTKTDGGGEKIAMTAPVLTKTDGGGEKIAMTAPVLTKTDGGGEKIAMTAPVLTKTDGGGEKIAMTAPVLTKSTDGGEKIAMTAPVLTKSTDGGSEKIAMTAPVLTKSTDGGGEKIAMTAPVLTKTDGSSEKIAMTVPVTTKEGNKMVTMRFTLPSMYKKAEDAPKPVDERVVIREEREKKYGVVKFAGLTTDRVVKEKAEKLKKSLEKDGHKVIGEFLLARYNPPFTLPPFRTNEVMIPVE